LHLTYNIIITDVTLYGTCEITHFTLYDANVRFLISALSWEIVCGTET